MQWFETMPRFLYSIIAVCVVVLTPETSVGEPASSDADSGSKVDQVIVAFTTHFDIGYTDLASKIVARYRTSMIDNALDVCDASRDLPPEHRFVWTLPGWPMAQTLWPGQDPVRRKRIEEAIRQNRVVWHALPVTTHTESLDLEDLVRGLRFSSALSRKFGRPLPRDAKMTDVPSHTWILPTVLKHAGVEFLHIGCNSVSGSPELPRLFWWEGPDGSRVLTMYEAGGYGSGILPPKDWPYRTWLGLIHTGDNAGPPKPDEVRKLLARAHRELPGATVRMGRLSDFADAIRAENPKLPVVRGDMPDTWIHGIMSMPVETRMARRLRQRTAALEALTTLLRAWGADVPDPNDTVAAAYEGTLMFGEHTWGYSMSPFGYYYGDEWAAKREQGHYQRLEESWAEKGAWVRDARAAVDPLLLRNMSVLGRAVNVDGPRIVVFNPLPWERDAIVSVDVPPGQFPGLEDLAGGIGVPIEVDGKAIRFVARGVPSMGYRTYVPADNPAARAELAADDKSAAIAELAADDKSSAIENRWYRVQLDPSRGRIASIRDKRTGQELVDNQSPYGFGQYLYERFDEKSIRRYYDEYLKYMPGWGAYHFARDNMPPQVPYAASSPDDFTLRLLRSEVSVSAVMTAPAESQGAESVSLKVTLYRDQPYVDLSWSIRNKRPDPWPEAGWLCLPLAVDQPSYRLGRLGSIVDPAKDVVNGSNFDVFCLSSGMTVSGSSGKGVAVCPVDSPLVSIGRPGLYRHTSPFGERRPVLFVNLFNNVWGTNFQQWTGGSWSSRFRIWAVESNKQAEANLITPSWQARNSCLATRVEGPAGKLPPTRTGLQLSRKGVLVTALGANPDGQGTILRLWEQAGQSGPCAVTLPEGIDVASVQPVDLRGRAMGDRLPVHDRTIQTNLKPFAPASFVIGAVMTTDKGLGDNMARGLRCSFFPQPTYAHCTDPDDAIQLTDGKATSDYFWTQKGTVGWQRAQFATVTLDLGKIEPIAGVSMTTAAGVAGVTWPAAIHVLVSDDGKAYRDVGDLVALDRKHRGPWPDGYAIRRVATGELETRGRYVRLLIVPLPAAPYIFTDEIEIFRGDAAWLAHEPAGPVVEAAQLFQQVRVGGILRNRFDKDALAIGRLIGQSELPQPDRDRLLQRIDAASRQFDPAAFSIDGSFRAVLPIGDAHARLFAVQADLWRTLGRPSLCARVPNTWDPVDPFAMPPSESQGQIEIHTMRGEYRAAAVNLFNATDRPMKVRLRFAGLPGGPVPNFVTVHEVEWTDTSPGIPVAAALPEAKRDGDRWCVAVMPGLVRQVWLTFHATDLEAGEYTGRLIAEAQGLAAVEVPIGVRVWPLTFPERTTLHVGGWSYTDSGGRYGMTPANRAAFLKHLQSRFVNTPWATSGVLRSFEFDKDDPEKIDLDTRAFDEWIQQWPDAKAYYVFLAVAHYGGAIQNTMGGTELGSPEFDRRVATWISAWVRHLKSKGIAPNRLGLLIHDEPHEGSDVRALLAWARAIRKAEPDVVIWEDPTYRNPAAAPAELFEASDVLCPNRPMWLAQGERFARFYRDQRSRGRELQFYSCSGPAKLLDPYSYYRLQAWHCRRVGGTGSFFWAMGDNGGASSWNEYCAKTGPFTPLFLDAETVTAGKQMEAIRESAEDFEYFVMLEAAVARAKATGRTDDRAVRRAEALLQTATDAVLDAENADKLQWHDPKDRTVADRVRVRILDALAELQTKQ